MVIYGRDLSPAECMDVLYNGTEASVEFDEPCIYMGYINESLEEGGKGYEDIAREFLHL